MNLRFKLITTIASVCILVSVLVVTVFAISQPRISVTGDVSFNAEKVYAQVWLYKASNSVSSKNHINYIRTGATIEFNGGDEETDTQSIDLDNLTDTNFVTGFKFEIVDTSTSDDELGVKISSLTLPQIAQAYTQFIDIEAYINDVKYESGVTDLNSIVANGSSVISVEVVITLTKNNQTPDKINDIFAEGDNGNLSCVLTRHTVTA